MVYVNRKNIFKQWEIINETLKRKAITKESEKKLITDDGKILTKSEEICNEFNIFFANIGPKRASKIPKTLTSSKLTDIHSSSNSFYFEPITPEETYQQILLGLLDENKAKGIDNIPAKVIKLVAEYLALTLSTIFNFCSNDGIFPAVLKVAKITPVHKSESKSKLTNYRPISILTPFSKNFEKLICKRLTKFFGKNDTICKEQFGFRSKHSTLLVIANLVLYVKYKEIGITINTNVQ